MKKVVLSVLVASAFLSSSAFAAPLTVNGGQVTFNGSVTNGACSVIGSDVNKTVDLPAVKVTAFSGVNTTGNAKTAFTIGLADCDISTYRTVAITYSGQGDATNPAYLGNSNPGAGAAKNVALQLYGQDGKVLALGSTEAGKLTMVQGSNVLRYAVDYVATSADAVTPGPVVATADFKLTYE